MAIRLGSWGTPELGITERIGSWLGTGQTGQGGSDIWTNQPAPTQSWSDPRLNTVYNQASTATTRTGGVPTPRTTADAISLGQSRATTSAPTSAAPTQAPSGDGGDPYAGIRSGISSAWDQYISSLDDQLAGLGTQRTAQEEIIGSQYKQSAADLGLQKQQGIEQLGTQRARTQQSQNRSLRDLSENIRNSFMAGNVFLGSRGAGDSSAANQYAYALTKLGTQQRGDIMGQTANIMADIDSRESNLNNIYNTEINKLDQDRNIKINQVAQWFADAQNQIRQAKAQGAFGKAQDLNNLSRDVLNQAISQVNSIEQNAMAQKNALVGWATGVSKNIGELRSNLAQISNINPVLPGFTPIAGAPQVDSSGNIRVASGYGSSSDEQRRLLGQ